MKTYIAVLCTTSTRVQSNHKLFCEIHKLFCEILVKKKHKKQAGNVYIRVAWLETGVKNFVSKI